jgi:hypothetical protein
MERKTEESVFDSWKGQEIFVLSKTSSPSLGLTQPPYSVGTRVPCPVVKLPGCEFDHLNPSKTKVKNTWSHISASLHTFMWCIGKNALELGYNVLKRVCLFINERRHNRVI